MRTRLKVYNLGRFMRKLLDIIVKEKKLEIVKLGINMKV